MKEYPLTIYQAASMYAVIGNISSQRILRKLNFLQKIFLKNIIGNKYYWQYLFTKNFGKIEFPPKNRSRAVQPC